MDTPCPAVVAQRTRADAGLKPFHALQAMRPRGVVVHCSAGQQPRSTEHAAERLRVMQSWHRAPKRWEPVLDGAGQPVLRRDGTPKRRNVGGCGWVEIGYSWAFDDLGNVWELRGWGHVGSHCSADPDGRGSLNGRAHGFVYLGNGLRPTAAALEAGAWLVAESERQYGPGFVIGHREVSAKPCPGDGVFTGLVLPLGRPLVAR